MAKRSVKLPKDYLKSCPHCGGPLQDFVYPDGVKTQKRCRLCRCRWNLDGFHVHTGRGCPVQERMPLSA